MTNWAAYDAGLRARGSLTIWFSDEAVEGWRAEARAGPGGQPRHSSLAIITALTLRALFRLALRRTEGLIGSIPALLGLDLPVPDHSTMSRRAETLEVPPLRSSPSAMPSRRSTSRKTSRPPSEESCSPSERAIRGLPRTGDRPGSKG